MGEYERMTDDELQRIANSTLRRDAAEMALEILEHRAAMRRLEAWVATTERVGSGTLHHTIGLKLLAVIKGDDNG
jgi:L-rhamnose isomerase